MHLLLDFNIVKWSLIVIWSLKSHVNTKCKGVCLFLQRRLSLQREQKGSPHPNTFKCIVYLQTVLNGGPGVFLFLYSYIQRNYKEQAWLHFQNWAPLPSTTAWLAPSWGGIDSSVKAESCPLILWEVGESHSTFQVSRAFYVEDLLSTPI